MFSHICTSTKPCEASSQWVSKHRLKQTKPDASIIAASECLTQTKCSYSRAAFNSPCSSDLSHTHTHPHAQYNAEGQIELNEMFSIAAIYNHVIRNIFYFLQYFA